MNVVELGKLLPKTLIVKWQPVFYRGKNNLIFVVNRMDSGWSDNIKYYV